MAGCHPNLAPRNDSVHVMMWKLLSYMTDLLKQQTGIEKFSRGKTVMSFVAEVLFIWFRQLLSAGVSRWACCIVYCYLCYS